MRTLCAAVLASSLAGCAYQPIVDRPGPTYAQDLTECRAAAQGTSGPGTGAAVGAGVGYALGQVLCRTLGGRDCSGVGRATAIAGGSSGAVAGAQQEAQVVRNCLLGRGHRVLN